MSEQESPASSLESLQDPSSRSYVRPRYLPLLPLSRGGMANVELAIGLEAGNYKKLVVQKTIREEFASDPELVAMFLDEARLCARLNHNNLVQVYEVLENPRPCLVMEYLEGLAMTEIQRRLGSRFETALQLRILSDVLAGLHYAHELSDFDGRPLGIVHRDVSPQNVMVTSDGRVKVLDFGIAKTADSSTYTQAGMVKGKMSYMSPEQVAGERLDRRTDVFAVGCMLWRAASGKKLWSKMAPEDIMRCLVKGQIPPPSIHREVDPALEAIVMRATAPNRLKRYESADQLRRALDEYSAEKAGDCDLRAWMQGTFKECWAEQRQKISSCFADATSVPPVGSERFSSTTIVSIAPETRSSRLITIGVVAAAVALLVVGAAGLVQRLQLQAITPGNTRVESTAEKSELLIQLHAEPIRARIVFDGRPLDGNPTEQRVANGSEHVVEVTLPGYRTVSRKLRFDRETTLEFALVEDSSAAAAPTSTPKKSPASPRSTAAKTGRASQTASTASAGDPQKADPCEPPFYFKDGIKTYKAECLR